MINLTPTVTILDMRYCPYDHFAQGKDIHVIGELHQPDVAMLPIGDYYTMGPREAAIAVRMLGVKYVIPMPYGTFPILTGTPAELRDALLALGLNEVEVVEMKPGQTIS